MACLGSVDWEAPMALELGSGMRLGEPAGWHDYLGIYKLESREVNGKPCWRHAERSDLWLAFDGVGWAAQPEDRLGDRFGWLQLRDPGAPTTTILAGGARRRFPLADTAGPACALCRGTRA